MELTVGRCRVSPTVCYKINGLRRCSQTKTTTKAVIARVPLSPCPWLRFADHGGEACADFSLGAILDDEALPIAFKPLDQACAGRVLSERNRLALGPARGEVLTKCRYQLLER
jgi:hypothetical protein